VGLRNWLGLESEFGPDLLTELTTHLCPFPHHFNLSARSARRCTYQPVHSPATTISHSTSRIVKRNMGAPMVTRIALRLVDHFATGVVLIAVFVFDDGVGSFHGSYFDDLWSRCEPVKKSYSNNWRRKRHDVKQRAEAVTH
jgi:hypothetical protein